MHVKLSNIYRGSLRLQARRGFQPGPSPSEAAGRVAFSFRTADFARPIGGGPTLGDVHLRPGDLDMWLDLEPYANASCYVVQVRGTVIGLQDRHIRPLERVWRHAWTRLGARIDS